MKILLFLIFTILSFTMSTTKEPTQEELEAEYVFDFIEEVNPMQYKEHIEKNEFTLSIFYYIESTHYCRKIFNILTSLKSFFKLNNITLIMVNARIYEKFFLDHQFKIIPGIILYRKNNFEGVMFDLDQNKEDLEMFIKKRINPLITLLNSAEELNAFTNYSDIVVVQFGTKVPTEALANTSKAYQYILFAVCKSLDCFKAYNIDLFNEITVDGTKDPTTYDEKESFYSPSVVAIFNKKTKKYSTIKSSEEADVEKLIDDNSHPAIAEVNEISLHRLFKSGKATFIVFDDEKKLYRDILESASPKISSYGLVIMYSDPSQSYHFEFMNSVGVTKASLPTFIIVEKKEELNIFKYNYDPISFDRNPKTITKHMLLNFANDWKYDQVKPVPKSEPITYNKDKHTVKLVGHNFIEVISNPDTAVLVKFYTKECKFCVEFAPTFEELARVVSPSKQIIIAEIDVKENFVPIKIEKLPTMVLFTKEEVRKNIIYEYDRNLFDMIAFLRRFSGAEVEVIKEDF